MDHGLGEHHPRRVINLQLVVLILAGFIGFRFWGRTVAEAALYGVLIALANTGLLMWRMRRGAPGELDARQHLKGFYRSSVERYLLVAILFGMGMGLLKLQPPVMMVGFALGQLAWIVALLVRGRGA
jgi:ATP synthase protein I